MSDQIKIYDNTNNGSISYAEDVIATIAGVAAIEIQGVVGMSGGISGGITELLGKKNLTKGIKVDIANDEAVIDINIVVEYGCEIHNVADKIQENVRKSVETMTGLRVVKVNVNVQGVNVKQEPNKTLKLK